MHISSPRKWNIGSKWNGCSRFSNWPWQQWRRETSQMKALAGTAWISKVTFDHGPCLMDMGMHMGGRPVVAESKHFEVLSLKATYTKKRQARVVRRGSATMHVAWQAQYGGCSLRWVSFWSISSSGLPRWFGVTGAALRMTWPCFVLDLSASAFQGTRILASFQIDRFIDR